MDPANTDQWVARLAAALAALVGAGTLARRWRKDSAGSRSAGEGAYIDGTKAALTVLQQQVADLRGEIADLRNRASAFRSVELDYVGQIKKLENQNWEQAQEIEELKQHGSMLEQRGNALEDQNRRQAEEIKELKHRLNMLELKNGQ